MPPGVSRRVDWTDRRGQEQGAERAGAPGRCLKQGGNGGGTRHMGLNVGHGALLRGEQGRGTPAPRAGNEYSPLG